MADPKQTAHTPTERKKIWEAALTMQNEYGRIKKLNRVLLEILESIKESATDGRDCPEWLEERIEQAEAAIKAARGE